MSVKTLDPKEISIIVASHIVTGYADGTFVTIEYDEDAFSFTGGADGLGTRVKNANRSGKVTIIIQQSSPTNAYFSGLAIADQVDSKGLVPILVKDASGQDTSFCETAWIEKMPNASNSKDVENREWVFRTDNLEMFLGGNA